MIRKALFLIVVITAAAGSALADAQADAIMQASYALPQAQSMQATLYMLLVDAHGGQSLRAMSMYSRKVAGGTDSYTVFLSPPDVQGTKFLSLATPDGGDVQRIWLPALGKVRRIAGGGKGEKFVGSDLTYYDMASHHFSDARYTMHGEDVVQVVVRGTETKVDCWVIDSTPVDPSVPYGRIRVWVGKDDSFIYRSTMWDGHGSDLKSIYILEVEKGDGVILPIRTGVIAADGHKTLLQMNNVQLNRPIDPGLFTVANLER